MKKRGTKLYKILKAGRIIESPYPGRYAGITTTKCFGTLDCKSGVRALSAHRVFFHSWEDAERAGYRPCQNCKPSKVKCDHMPFGLAGGFPITVQEIKNKKKKVCVSCTLCGKKLGIATKMTRGRIKWSDGLIGYVVPHELNENAF